MAPAGLAWDACGLLNLAATGRAAEILRALRGQSYVVRQVLAGEVLWLRSPAGEERDDGLVEADLSAEVAAGLLQEVELTGAERDTFVRFAAGIDDGEARTAALAHHRHLAVVTDDRAALRILARQSPPIPALTTPECLRQWIDGAGVPKDQVAEVLRQVGLRAHYRPRRGHPLRSWWNNLCPGG